MNSTKGIFKYKRDFPPADYSLKVDSYTLLLESKTEKYDTDVFEAGGHKWRLSFYPNGDMKNNAKGYISLYLIIAETDSYAPGWEVNVNFKFLVYDQMEDKYLTIQDVNGAVRRFHATKKEWGFAQLLSLERFKDLSCGYLVNDSCVFGVDVVVMNYSGNWESISLVKEPRNGTFTWKIDNFSNLNQATYFSKVFNVEGINWTLLVYPNGYLQPKDKSFSIFLELADWGSHPIKEAVYAEYNLRVLDQVNGRHVEKKVDGWFKGDALCRGCPTLVSWSDLRDASNGFIVKNILIVEVVFHVISYSKVSSKTKYDQNGSKVSNLKKQLEVSRCTIL